MLSHLCEINSSSINWGELGWGRLIFQVNFEPKILYYLKCRRQKGQAASFISYKTQEIRQVRDLYFLFQISNYNI